MTEPRVLRPSTALAAYGEPLIEGRRVLVFGEATSSLAEILLERGARTVHFVDRDTARVAEASTRNTSRNVSFAPLGDGGLALRDGAFDVAIVENLATVGDVSLALGSIKRALSARGVAIIACANPDVEICLLETANAPKISIDYYSLYDAVAEEFEYVRMLGQTPFVGYAVADFAPDAEPLPALDTGCVPGGAEEPEWFVALASHRALLLDEFAIIQLPFSSTWRRSGSDDLDSLLRAARSSERRARQRVAALEAENRRLTRGTSRSEGTDDIERLKKTLEKRDAFIEELEARLTAADARADETQQQLDEYIEAHPEPDPAEARKRETDAAAKAEGKAQAEAKAAREAKAEAEAKAKAAAEAMAKAEAKAMAAAEAMAKAEAKAKAVAEAQKKLTEELDEAKRKLERAERDLDEARQRTDAAEQAAQASRDAQEHAERERAELQRSLDADTIEPEQDIAHLEAQLAERGREILRLERDLSKTEAMAKNLLHELEELRSSADAPSQRELELKLDELAQKNAAREADLVALRWTLAQLSGTPIRSDSAEKSPE